MATDKEKRYSGIFAYKGQELPGHITYSKENGHIDITLTKRYEAVVEYCQESWDERLYEESNRIRTVRIPYIGGTLHNGDKVTLFNCSRYYDVCDGDVRVLKFRAEYMIFDELQDTTVRYNRFTFVLENGLLWSGMSQVVNQQNKKDLSQPVRFRTNGFVKKYTWADTKVKFSTELNYNDLTQPERVERCSITEHLKVQLIAESGNKPVKDFLKMRDQIMEMISFAIKGNVNIISQYFCAGEDYYTYGTYTGKEEREYIKYHVMTDEKQCPLFKHQSDEYNFFLQDLPEKKDLGVTIGKLLPVFQLYSSLYRYRDMPLVMRFLNITQALETFHSRFFYNNEKAKMVASVKARFGILEESSTLRKQLLAGLNNPNILLVSRLNDLFVRGSNKLFAEFYEEDPEYAYRVAQTRNYLTHYPMEIDGEILEGNDLRDAGMILMWLLEYHVCTALGIAKTEEKIRYQLYPDQEREYHNNLLQENGYYDK